MYFWLCSVSRFHMQTIIAMSSLVHKLSKVEALKESNGLVYKIVAQFDKFNLGEF